MAACKRKTSIPAANYFEHNDTKVTAYDIIDWPDPITVTESTNPIELEKVQRAWLQSIKDSQL